MHTVSLTTSFVWDVPNVNTGEMRGMCDEGERITKGVGGIRVSCYDPVTLLEHGRMRLRAQHVNKGGGHICKTHRWPHPIYAEESYKAPCLGSH